MNRLGINKFSKVNYPPSPYKTCTLCKEFKLLSEFDDRKKSKDGKHSWCISCRKKYNIERYHRNRDRELVLNRQRYMNHREQHLAKNKEYRARNKSRINEYSKTRGRKIRELFLDMYGGKCVCCGESERVFLTIDHINGQEGLKKKERGVPAYTNAIREYKPDIYRVLCMNCNGAVRWGRTCPHQIKRSE